MHTFLQSNRTELNGTEISVQFSSVQFSCVAMHTLWETTAACRLELREI